MVKLRVVELVPNRRVEWECISTHPRTSPAFAWTGTHFIFELSERPGSGAPAEPRPSQDRGTRVDFRQVGYDEQSPFLESNAAAWGQVLNTLKRVVER